MFRVCFNDFWHRRQWCASGICDETKPGVVNTREDQNTIQEGHEHLENRSERGGMKPKSVNGSSCCLGQTQTFWL